jgi:hypothetical protein
MILDHLVQIKLIKKNGKQRIHSTHVIAKVRELSRLELLQETLRLFCDDALSFRPEGSRIGSDALDRYQDQKSLYQMTDETKASRIRVASKEAVPAYPLSGNAGKIYARSPRCASSWHSPQQSNRV